MPKRLRNWYVSLLYRVTSSLELPDRYKVEATVRWKSFIRRIQYNNLNLSIWRNEHFAQRKHITFVPQKASAMLS